MNRTRAVFLHLTSPDRCTLKGGRMARKTLPLIDRLLRQISPEPNTGCWLWTGPVTGGGYGQISIGRRIDGFRPAHRVSYELHVGPIPAGLDLDHLCRVKICVNPAHLEPVTRRENLMRGNAVGQGTLAGSRASVAAKLSMTHCRKGHEYGPNRRRCLECYRRYVDANRDSINARKRDWRAKRKSAASPCARAARRV